MQTTCLPVARRKLAEGQALLNGIVPFEMSDSDLVEALGRAIQKQMRAYHHEDFYLEFDLVDYLEGGYMTADERLQQEWIDELAAQESEEAERRRETYDSHDGCYLTAEQKRKQDQEWLEELALSRID